MNEVTELNDLNREDEAREDLKHEADRDYPKPFEGTLDINKVMAERDELDRLLIKMCDLVARTEETNDLLKQAKDSYEKLYEELRSRIMNFEHLLKMIGDKGEYKGCGAEIYWLKSRKGKPMPITIKGINHFADCPKADNFRK